MKIATTPVLSFALDGRARVSRARATLRDIGVRTGVDVLEIGCGPGVMLEVAAGLVSPGRLHGADADPELVRRARARLAERGIAGVDVGLAVAGRLPHPDGVFDLVYMITVIGELPDPDAGLADARRVLKPGGVLAVTEQVFDPHYTRPQRVRRLCESAGFRHLGTTSTLLEHTSRFTA
jgi:ubiquinone/menaquinone biosynthesis C-methylase UbiE